MNRKKNKVSLDIRPVLLDYEKKTGIKIGQYEIAKEIGVNYLTMHQWKDSAPLVVKFIFEFMQITGCKFEDLVKENK